MYIFADGFSWVRMIAKMLILELGYFIWNCVSVSPFLISTTSALTEIVVFCLY